MSSWSRWEGSTTRGIGVTGKKTVGVASLVAKDGGWLAQRAGNHDRKDVGWLAQQLGMEALTDTTVEGGGAD